MLKRNVTQRHLPLLEVLFLGLALVLSPGLSLAAAHAGDGQVSLFGRVIDLQGEPVRGAKVSLVLNGAPLGDGAENEHSPPLAESQPDGTFVVDLPSGEAGTIKTLMLKISRPHFKSLEWEAEDDEVDRLNRGQSLRLSDVGLISHIATGIHYLVGENLVAATLVIIWATGLLCFLIPTIPLTAALLPVVSFLARTLPGAGNKVLFYSLSVGSALGANTSLIGATNNMVTAGIADRAGYPITYRGFLKVGLPAAVLTLIVGTLWILIRFQEVLNGDDFVCNARW